MLTISTNSGQPFETEAPSTILSGFAPITIANIVYQEEELPLLWSSTTNWTTTVSLSPGINNVQLNGYDGFGQLVSSDTIAVTNTMEWPAPEISGMTPTFGKNSGGNLVTIHGVNFNWSSQVFFDSVEAEITYQTETMLKVVTPPGEGAVTVTVVNEDGNSVIASDLFQYAHPFLRGDPNRDGMINLADPILILGYMFNHEQLMCRKAADTNDSGQIDLADAIFLLTYQFDNGMAPPTPAT